MSSTFHRINRLLSILIALIGILLIAKAVVESGFWLSVGVAFGIVMIVYGVVRYLAYGKYLAPRE